MKHHLLRSTTYGVGLGIVAMGNHGLPVNAQVSSQGGSLTRLESIAAEVRTEGTAEPANAWVNRLTGDPALTQGAVNLPAESSLSQATLTPSATVESPTHSVSWSKGLPSNPAATPSSVNPRVSEAQASSLKSFTRQDDALATQPVPQTLTSSADSLTLQPTQDSEIVLNESQTLAQTDLDIRRGPDRVPNYVGVGVNIGLTEGDDDDNNANDGGGETGLGDAGFVINGKIGLSRNLSLRPGVIIGNDAVFMVPLTYDFVIPRVDPFEPIRFAPFLGGGIALSTDADDNIGFLLTGGVDVPLSRSFVANGSINIGFIEDQTDVGIILGVGYTFADF
ncbi:MAG: hypothetical protein RID09_11960 [Coleofasciculus sp. G1-WW12-02]|uniref:hypothetical protein n=1 Tax=Coleofasciculus sp. G1-WW12-02 TaxID=3068483 RepID=UPI0032FCD753